MVSRGNRGAQPPTASYRQRLPFAGLEAESIAPAEPEPTRFLSPLADGAGVPVKGCAIGMDGV